MPGLSLEFEFRNQRYQDASRGLETFAQAIKSDWDGSAKVLSRELRSFLDSVGEALVKRHTGAWPGGTSDRTLSRRSGKLANSIMGSIKVRGQTFQTIEGSIGAAFPAQVHEFGATITPKSAKYLAVPLKAALDSKGVPLKKGPREWPNTFVAKSKVGNLIIFQKRGSQITPLYVLKTGVTIKPRLGVRKTLDAGLPYFVERAMDAMVRDITAAKGEMMTTSVRQQILEAIRDAYIAVEPPPAPVDDNDWPFQFSTVAIGPLTEPDHRKRYSIGVVAQAEQEEHLYPYIVCFLRVGVEFRITVNRDDDAPAIAAENVLTVVKRVIMNDKSWGGLALDTKMAGNEIDLTSYGDRSVMGVQFIEIQYRHAQRDPRTRASSM